MNHAGPLGRRGGAAGQRAEAGKPVSRASFPGTEVRSAALSVELELKGEGGWSHPGVTSPFPASPQIQRHNGVKRKKLAFVF